MRKFIFTLSICLVALAVSAQPASKKHGLKLGHSVVNYTASSDGHSLTTKKHGLKYGHSEIINYTASLDGHSLMTKKHGLKYGSSSVNNYTGSPDRHSLITKKHGRKDARFEESSLAENMERTDLDDQ